MTPRNLTFTDIERLQPRTGEDHAFVMDEESFRGIYERTARPIWAFLCHKTGDAQLADDLLQETYYRFLKSGMRFDDEAHRRNYLFRIAANLAADSFRNRRSCISLSETAAPEIAAANGNALHHGERKDLECAMSQLTSRQRDALWLAYVEGSSHEEIAGILGLRTGSIKVLLFRARRQLAKLLGGWR